MHERITRYAKSIDGALEQIKESVDYLTILAKNQIDYHDFLEEIFDTLLNNSLPIDDVVICNISNQCKSYMTYAPKKTKNNSNYNQICSNKTGWTTPWQDPETHKNKISYCAQFGNKESIRIDLSTDNLKFIIEKEKPEDLRILCILDTDGEYIYTDSETLKKTKNIYQGLSLLGLEECIKKVKKTLKSKMSDKINLKLNHKKRDYNYLIFTAYIHSSKWTIATHIGENIALSTINKKITEFSTLIISVLIMLFIIVTYTSRKIVTPLTNLNNSIKHFSKNNTASDYNKQEADEIYELSKSFNFMINTIRDRDKELRNSRQQYIDSFLRKIKGVSFYFTLDNSYRFLHTSDSIEKILGYRKKDLHCNFFDIFSNNEEIKNIRKKLGHIKLNGGVSNFTATVQHCNGQYRKIEASCTYINDISGNSYFEGMANDITESKKIQENLRIAYQKAEKANRAKGSFLSNISHELRTPLNGILGYSQVMLSNFTLDKKTRENLASIQSCGQHLLMLINDVLDLTKIESGSVTIKNTPVFIKSLINDIKSILFSKAKAKNIDFSIILSNNIPDYLVFDEIKARQILLNLAGNAVKYTTSGKVIIKVKVIKNSKICFIVADSGSGIPHDKKNEIFQPFFRLEGNSKTESGAGLGLPISKSLIDLMNGTIKIKSTLDKGSVFCVCIPAKPVKEKIIKHLDKERTNKSITEAITIKNKLHAFVVDDDDVSRNMLAQWLKLIGFNVDQANGGHMLFKKLSQSIPNPDVIFLDIKMPEMDGHMINKILKQTPSYNSIKVIAVTADTSNFKEENFDGLIKKPIQYNELIKSIKNNLGASISKKKSSLPLTSYSTNKSTTEFNQIIEILKTSLSCGDIINLEETIINNSNHFNSHTKEKLLSYCHNLDIEKLEIHIKNLERLYSEKGNS